MSSQPSVAIIGAGIAGLTCGTALKGMVPHLKVFEKSVFPGGRISNFRAGEFEFNHGAQYFTVNNPLFLNIVSAWQADNIVRPWDAWLVELQKGQVSNGDMATQRFIGYPRMTVIAETLAKSCDVVYSSNICEIERQAEGGWRLFNERGDYLGAFDVVILATAASETAMLASQVPQLKDKAESIEMAACWSGMFAFQNRLDIPYDAAYVLDSALSWICRDQHAHAAPNSDCWVLHATPEWSQQYIASFRGRVMHALLDAFWEDTDIPEQQPVSASEPVETGVRHRGSKALC